MRNTTYILLLLLMMLTGLASAGAQQTQPEIDKSKLRLSWNREKLSLYQHEPAVLTLYLWTPGYEIQGLRRTKASSLDKGKFGYLSHVEFDRQPRVVEKDGETWYVYPIESYAVAMDKAGKYNLKGGRYMLDLAIPTIYDDPFWGRMQTMTSKKIEVPVSPIQITVSELPLNPDGSEFSGAVGDFTVDVTVPPGDIYLNEEATAIVTVRGNGWLNDDTMPEYHDAFKNGTRLKSFSENRQQYLEGSQLVSEFQMECTFIPTSADAEIGEIRMEVFNPTTGKYQIVKSSPVRVKVQSIAKKAPVHDI